MVVVEKIKVCGFFYSTKTQKTLRIKKICMHISFQKVNDWTPNISCLIVKSFFNKCELETFKFLHDTHVFQILVFYKKRLNKKRYT